MTTDQTAAYRGSSLTIPSLDFSDSPQLAADYHQQFKAQVIAPLPDRFELPTKTILTWINNALDEDRNTNPRTDGTRPHRPVAGHEVNMPHDGPDRTDPGYRDETRSTEYYGLED